VTAVDAECLIGRGRCSRTWLECITGYEGIGVRGDDAKDSPVWTAQIFGETFEPCKHENWMLNDYDACFSIYVDDILINSCLYDCF